MRRIAKAAFRSTQRNQEERLIFGRNRSAFFSYVNSKTGRCSSAVKIVINDGAKDYETSNIFCRKFMNNFSAHIGSRTDPHLFATAGDSAMMFNCSGADVLEPLISYPSSNSNSDGISFRLLKTKAKLIIRLLNIIFQNSIQDGVFPSL